jgi:hypothetical protein
LKDEAYALKDEKHALKDQQSALEKKVTALKDELTALKDSFKSGTYFFSPFRLLEGGISQDRTKLGV